MMMGTQHDGATALFSNSDFAFPRYLAANNGDPVRATMMQMEGLAWRAKFRPDLLRIEDAIECLEKYNLYASGTVSRQGASLIFCDRFRAHSPQAETPYSINRSTLLGNAYVLENSVTMRTPNVVVIVCCAGLTRAMVDERYIRIVTETLTLAFPGTITEFVFHSLPTWVNLALKALWTFVPKDLRQMIHICGGDPRATLARICDPSQLPVRFGGTQPDSMFSPAAFIARRRQIEDEQGPTEKRVDVGFPPWIWIEPLPAEAARLPNTLISGRLKKIGAIVRLWKSFFVVVTSTAIFYFKNETDAIAHGGVELRRAIVRRAQTGIDSDFSSATRPRGFVLETPLRAIQFLCRTEQDRERWLAVITHAIPIN